MLKPIIFSTQACDLGESPLWHKQRKSLFWLDISNKILYEKSFNSTKKDYDRKWNLPYVSSAIVEYSKDKNRLYLLTEHSFGLINLKTGEYSGIIKLSLTDEFRTNDGGVAPDGSFWFGTMQKKPTGQAGCVYSLSSTGKLIKQLENIGIPNTFCWSNTNNKLYISDSFRQKLFSYTTKKGRLQLSSEKEFVNLSNSKATPDGGAMDANNNLWNAHWDGGKIACLDEKGKILKSIKMPIPKPSSCCFGGPNNQYLFISSAKEDMTIEEIKKYPMSGMIFMLVLPVSGQLIHPFYLETIL